MNDQQTVNRIKEIVTFCIEHQGRCWHGWSASKIFKYVAYHFLAGTLFTVRANSTIAGVGIAWLGNASEFIRRDIDKYPPFDWRLPEKGDALMVGELFGSRSSCGQMRDAILDKWPIIKRVFAYRNDTLIEFPLAKITRFVEVKNG